MMDDRRKFMTVYEVADYWGVSTDKVYDDIRRGGLAAYKVGGLFRVRFNDAMNYGQPIHAPTSAVRPSTM